MLKYDPKSSFKPVCDDFTDFVQEIIKRGYDFYMYTDSFTGNVGIHIPADDSKRYYVDVCQYMSPTNDKDMHGYWYSIPIGLSVLYGDTANRYNDEFDDGGMDEYIMGKVVEHLNKNLEEEIK